MRADRYGFFHDSAAGDFLLMSRAMAHAIRGYPEIPTNIMIDGTAIHAAAAHGYGQLLFADDCVIFHQVLFLRVRGCRPTAFWLWHEACRFSLPEHLLVFLCRSVTLFPLLAHLSCSLLLLAQSSARLLTNCPASLA